MFNKMFNKIFKKIKENICYKKQIKNGGLNKGDQCKGIKGGDRYSAYVKRECFNCTHYRK